jgi:Domain of unknown function (DUF4145)
MADATNTAEKLHCNACRQFTKHDLIAAAEERDSHEVPSQGEIWWDTKFEMFQCRGCSEVVLRRTCVFSEDEDPDIRYFPPKSSRHAPRWHYQLPSEFWPLLKEVYSSLDAGSHRLPLMGARTLVDMVVADKVGDVGSFRKKLEALGSNGYVSAQNLEVLFAALDTGSAAAHRGYAASADDLDAVMDIVENLLQAVYVLPKMAKRLKASTPPRKQTKSVIVH